MPTSRSTTETYGVSFSYNRTKALIMDSVVAFYLAIGRKVCKRADKSKGGKPLDHHNEPKPFKSGLKENTVKGIIKHPKLDIPAFIFEEDDSYVECRRCRLVEDDGMHVHVTDRTLVVSCFPKDSRFHRHMHITVEDRGKHGWAVMYSGDSLSSSGEWEYEPLPSERTDEWLTEHRFDLETALRLAKEKARTLRINNTSVEDALEKDA